MNIEFGRAEKETPFVMEYIRKRTKAGNIKIGMVVAAYVDGEVRVGWSLARQKGPDKDTFERTEGFQRSFERIFSKTVDPIPSAVAKVLLDKSNIMKLDPKTHRCVRDENGKPIEYTHEGLLTRAYREFGMAVSAK